MAANRSEWADLRAILVQIQRKLSSRLNDGLDAFVAARPEEEKERWQALFAAYLGEQRGQVAQERLQLLRGEKTRSAAQFDACISKRLTTSYIPLMTVMPDDIFSLSYLIKPHVTHTNANAMRAALGPISSQVVRLEDGISATSSWFEGRQQRSWRERAFGLIARAMGVGLEGLTDQAKAILAEAEFEVALRRDSVNRMRYIYANTVSFLLIALRGSSSRPLKLRFLESVQSARDS